MGKFKTMPRTRLKNGAHFTVDEAFLAKLKAADFGQAKITALLTAFEAAFADEDKYLQMARASDYTAQLAQADSERDALYTLVKQSVSSWITIGIEPYLTSALAVQKLNDTYRIDVKAQYDEETGRMTNWLADALTEACAAHLKTLGLSTPVSLMQERNEQVKTLLASRAEERGAKVAGALKAAREQTDELYAEITSLIESCSVLMDDTTPYETFISEWNAEIERIKQQTASKSSKGETVKE